MPANISNRPNSSSARAEQEQQMLRNVATTTEQPPNKFVLNTKTMSAKPPLAAEIRAVKISEGKDINMEKDSAKSLSKQDLQPSICSTQQVEDFAKKKQERDQEIMEIQEMLNKMKSPQKTSERSSQGSPIGNKYTEEEIPEVALPSSNIIAEPNEAVKKVEKETTFFGRCKTGLEVSTKPFDSSNSRQARRDTARTSSTATATNKPRSKSSQWPLSAKETKVNKKLNYNPEEARRYMEMQRKQRKENLLKDPTIRSKIEKEEIKKRLEELKKNTRKLAFKSLQKKEQILNKTSENKEADVTKFPEQSREVIEKSKPQGNSTSRTKLQNNKQNSKTEISQPALEKEKERAKSHGFANEVKKSSIENDQGITYRSTRSLNNVLKPSTTPFAENHKRIGLLRKTVNDKGFSLASHRNYNFDKENQNLEMLTKQLTHPADYKSNKEADSQNRNVKQEENAVKGKETINSELELSEKNIKSTTREEKTEPAPNELPYWLRPSATQVYPYNFIMAVRRKLESIAQTNTARKTDENKRNQETSTTDLNDELKSSKRKSLDYLEHKPTKKVKGKQEVLTELNKIEPDSGNVNEDKLTPLKPLSANKQIKKGESKKDQQCQEDDIISEEKKIFLEENTKSKTNIKYLKPKDSQNSLQSLSSDHDNCKEITQHFKSLESLNSEINSNFSSISLPIPISNTLTEVSSLRTESRRTYTHSKNHLLTHSEDEVGSLSSQIVSSSEKNPNQIPNLDFAFVKPRPVSPLSMEKVNKLKIERKDTDPQQTTNRDKEIDFTLLLEDFNRSLSQVIQVNEQLKNSLDKSQQILSPTSSKKQSESDKYTSDFEQTPTAMMSDRGHGGLKKSIEKSSENLEVRKRQLFEITGKIKPLSTAQKDEPPIKTKTWPALNLNLKSSSNISSTTADDDQKSSQSNLEDLDQSSASKATLPYETRLNEIEELKETLKQTILQSKKKRNEKLHQQHESETKEVSSQIKNNTEVSRSRSKTSIESETRVSGTKSAEISSKQDTQSEDNSNNLTSFKSNKEISQQLNKGGNFEKYQPQYRSVNKNLFQTSFREFPEKNIELKGTKHSLDNDNKQRKQYNPVNEISQEMTDYSSPHTSSFSNIMSSERSIKSSAKQVLPDSTHISKRPKSHEIVSNMEAIGHTQSKVDSTSHTRNDSKSESLGARGTALSSSIAEELLKTFESQSYDNENLPFNAITKTNFISNLNEQDEFVKSHVNRSRGDFQETMSKSSLYNESQLQQAIDAASQFSSTEFAQSADDEITSSVTSKNHLKTDSSPPSYYGGKIRGTLIPTTCPRAKTNERVSIGSEIVKFFKQYHEERDERRTNHNDTMSESSLNYSNVGLYEKLIQTETNKSQHLTALLRMREKALLDRTKGQIAWLEVQKARYKAKGAINQIAAIKKKQRGIILKMEKEREDIKRLLHTTTTAANSKTVSAATLQTAGGHKSTSQHNSPTKHKKRERLICATTPLTKPKTSSQLLTGQAKHSYSTSPILRATYELESSRAVEDLLRKREADLRKRREHVERLMHWHQRLDEEEVEVLSLERQLLSYNNAPYQRDQQQSRLSTATTSTSKEKLTPAGKAVSATLCEQVDNVSTTKRKCVARARKMEKRLKEIDKSLKELSHISASSATSGFMGQTTHNEQEDSVSSATNPEIEFVRTSGFKLNKLWRRLTSQQIEKFEPTRRYKLCKSDLERLYEEAKMAVLRDFAEDEERTAKELLEKSASNLSSMASPTADGPADMPPSAADNKIIEVPMLNLSSAASEAEEESPNNSHHNTTQQGNYSPSVAEENFKAQVLLNSSASSETLSEQLTPPAEDKQATRLENNVQMFLALSQRIQASGHHRLLSTDGHNQTASGDRRLQRSLSDTEISDVPKYKAEKTTTSQTTIQTIVSHSNASTTTGSSDAAAQHQRSKSSIVEMTYIPSAPTAPATPSNYTNLSQTPSQPTDHLQQIKQNDRRTGVEKGNSHQTNSSSRSSVICSVGAVTPLKTSQETCSDIASITEDGHTSNSSSKRVEKPKPKLSAYSGQVGGTNCEATAKEISNKLDEITAAVAQLSQMNALPSYESVAHTHLRNKSIEEPKDESNLSADASSSYSFNFENITTDKHSSPGSSASLTTLTSKTYTKESDVEHNETKESSSSTSALQHTHAATSTSPNTTTPKTFSKDKAKSSPTETFRQSMLEDRILDMYENDFESDLSNVTRIEDITQPIFETTVDTAQDNEDANENAQKTMSSSLRSKEPETKESVDNMSAKCSDKTYDVDELKNSLSPSDSGKSLSQTDFKSPTQSPERGLLPPPPPLPPSPPPPPPPPLSSSAPAVSSTISNQAASNHLMPDIINELELRRHQLILDNEHLKQYEHVTAVPYMYVREIPNKPPPPYVPPAHGSPMTTIFPSEDRIKDITFRRTHELYCELLKTEYCNEKGEKLPSVMDEQITNIYERIILDICREYLEEHSEILRDGDPTNFHSQLAFFNPPNRLRCIQDAIYKEVRTCLAMDKTQPKRSQIYSVYGQRAKQDHIGKIIIQEMYDEDDRWCNFHREESEVLHLMVEEMIDKNIAAIAKEVLLEEGGTIDEEAELKDTMVEENVANHHAAVQDISHFEENSTEEEEARKRQQLEQFETSSILMATVNDEDQTYSVHETTDLNQTASIEATELQDNAKAHSTNLTTSSNAVQTCT